MVDGVVMLPLLDFPSRSFSFCSGINFVLNSLIFNVLPIALEVSMVTGLLAYSCGPIFAGVTLASIGAYTGFTFAITQWR